MPSADTSSNAVPVSKEPHRQGSVPLPPAGCLGTVPIHSTTWTSVPTPSTSISTVSPSASGPATWSPWGRERFEAVEIGEFWLLETPAKPSCGWDGALERIATWAILRETATDWRLWFDTQRRKRKDRSVIDRERDPGVRERSRSARRSSITACSSIRVQRSVRGPLWRAPRPPEGADREDYMQRVRTRGVCIPHATRVH
nr:hypothetical protein [Halovivax sp. KZCA124]